MNALLPIGVQLEDSSQSQPCGDGERPAPTEAEPSAAFTPGPWEFDSGVVPPDGPQRYADIYVNGGDTIIASFNDLIPEGQANARLIAAAPKLLALLIRYRHETPLGHQPHMIAHEADALIDQVIGK